MNLSVAISWLLTVILIKEGNIKVHGIFLTDVLVLKLDPLLVHKLMLGCKK